LKKEGGGERELDEGKRVRNKKGNGNCWRILIKTQVRGTAAENKQGYDLQAGVNHCQPKVVEKSCHKTE